LSKIKVAIDFRVEDPRQGVGTAVLALAHGLSRIQNLDQEYVFLVYEHNLNWITPHLSGPCSAMSVPAPIRRKPSFLRAQARKLKFLRRLWSRSRSNESLLPQSDGFLEGLGCDVVHFPSQTACLTKIPSIYQPWDLQHCHYPEFFSADDLRVRNVRYPAFCRQARFVCIQTEWGKKDLIREYDVDPDTIVVIRWGTAFEAYQPPLETHTSRIRQELSLPSEFFVYPAITWPHKNHELILRALGQLRAMGRVVHVVFTGVITPYREHLDAIARELGVKDEVHFLGFVRSDQIQSIFSLATAMIFPSKFEGLGLPVLEAFRVKLPVLCSTATVLPEVAGSAALFFDPDSIAELVSAMERVQSSPELRAQLVAEGTRILERYSAHNAALELSRLYEVVAGKAEYQT
jgi:glycosyltransferase involved in cell wall biosynthesis